MHICFEKSENKVTANHYCVKQYGKVVVDFMAIPEFVVSDGNSGEVALQSAERLGIDLGDLVVVQ